jgi:hypothetical protein
MQLESDLDSESGGSKKSRISYPDLQHCKKYLFSTLQKISYFYNLIKVIRSWPYVEDTGSQ